MVRVSGTDIYGLLGQLADIYNTFASRWVGLVVWSLFSVAQNEAPAGRHELRSSRLLSIVVPIGNRQGVRVCPVRQVPFHDFVFTNRPSECYSAGMITLILMVFGFVLFVRH